MSKNKNIIKAIGTCADSNRLAEIMFQNNISVPKNFVISIEKVRAVYYGDPGIECKIFFNQPIIDLSLEKTGDTKNYMGELFIEDEAEKDIFGFWDSESSIKEMMRYVDLGIEKIKSEIRFHRILSHRKYSDLSEDIIKDDYFDENEGPREIIGFDRVFLNIAGKYGVSQEDLEACIVEEIKYFQEKEEKILGIKFANEKYLKNKKNFPSSYTKPNILTHPVFEKLPAFYGSTYESKAFETSMVIGGWHYSSGKTPILSSRIKMPETFKTAYEGEPVNRLFKEPIFGESQKIEKIWQNGGVAKISMTNEAVPFGEYKKILKAA